MLHRGSGDAVVLGLVIGVDVELAAPVGDEVFVVRLASLHLAQRRVGLARRQEPDLGAELALGGEENEGPVPGSVRREVEQLVRLEIDPLRRSAAERVPMEHVLALGDLVFGDEEEGLVVRGPLEMGRPVQRWAASSSRSDRCPGGLVRLPNRRERKENELAPRNRKS